MDEEERGVKERWRVEEGEIKGRVSKCVHLKFK